MEVRSFRLLSASVLGAVKLQLDGLLDRWCTDWGVQQGGMQVDCIRAWDASPQQMAMQWQRSYVDKERVLHFSWPAELATHVQRKMFPSDLRHVVHPTQSSLIAAGASEKAIYSLLDHIAASFSLKNKTEQTGKASQSTSHEFTRGSGAIFAGIRLGEYSFGCLFNGECIDSLSDQIKPPMDKMPFQVDYKKALRSVVVSLPVEVGQAEVDIGSLMQLGVGDVIRLDTSIDKPVVVSSPDGHRLFNGHIGTSKNAVAIEIVRGEK